MKQEQRPERKWLVTFPGGLLVCSICRLPERYGERGVCGCFEEVGGFFRDTRRAPDTREPTSSDPRA